MNRNVAILPTSSPHSSLWDDVLQILKKKKGGYSATDIYTSTLPDEDVFRNGLHDSQQQ